MLKRLILLGATAGLLATGQDTVRKFYLLRTVTGGTLNRITVRQPSSSARALRFDGGYIRCSVVCTYTATKNGTLTGGSAGTINKLDERGHNQTASATLDGTVASDTTVFTDTIAASSPMSIGGGLYLPSVSGTQKQFTAQLTSAGAGDLTIYFEYSEPQ